MHNFYGIFKNKTHIGSAVYYITALAQRKIAAGARPRFEPQTPVQNY